MTIRDLAVAVGFEIDKSSEKKAEGSIEGLKNFATKMLGAIAIGFSFTQMNTLAEEFNRMNTQIEHSTKGLGEQEEIQQKILAAANETRSSYGDTAKMVSNLVKENSKLFSSVDDAIEFNNAATKLFKTAGKTNEEIAGLMEAINVSFAHGAVDSGTITTLLEQAPEAVELLSKQLGTSSDKLEEMVSNGKISLEQLKSAFVSNSDTINKNFEQLDYSISDAILNIRNQWGLFCSSLWKGTGISNGIGKLMVRSFNSLMDLLKKLQPLVERIVRFALSSINRIFDFISKVGSVLGRIIEKIGGVENAIKILAVAAAAIWFALNAGKILSFLKGIGNLLFGINLKVLLIVAVIALLFLIIDDFINFMKGNDSVIGALFEKAGIDADKARQTIINAWGKIKNFSIETWAQIKESVLSILQALYQVICVVLDATILVIKSVFNGIKRFWSVWGTEIIAFFKKIFMNFEEALQGFLEIIQGVANFISSILVGDWQGAWEAIKEIFIGNWKMIVNFMIIQWESIKLLFKIGLSAIKSLWETIWKSISAFFQRIWNRIVGFIKRVLSSLLSSISSTISKIKQAIISGFTSAINWIKALPSKAVTWGKDIVDGIAKGITGAIGKVTGAVKGVADKITSFLHFSVPDEGPLTEYESWMPDMMEGLGKGIDGSKHRVLDRIKNFAGDMSMLMKSATANVSTTSNIMDRKKVSIVQNNEFHNTYSGDMRTQESISKGMKKSTIDATTQLAKGLVYVR